jgi:hypothetical protein
MLNLRLLSSFALLLAISSSAAVVAADVGNVQVANAAGETIGIAARGFPAYVGGRNVLITTGHAMNELMGGAGGQVGAVTLTDLNGREVGKAGRCLVQNPSGGFYTSDVLVYELTGGGQGYSLASTLPPKGTKVWVVSAEKFAGVVTDSNAEQVMVKLDRTLTVLHSSGSPVIDERGAVVGMLCGTANARTVIGCDPAVSILSKIEPRSSVRATTAVPTAIRAGTTSGARGGVQSYGTLRRR